MANNHRIKIYESYKDFTPPSWVYGSVKRLIESVPEKFIKELHSITLTNIAGLNHRRRRQKTISKKCKVVLSECSGLYHQKWQENQASIELFIDKIIEQYPAPVLKVSVFQDLLLADVLYHELGHHIHKTQAPEYQERETVAEKWQKELRRNYFRQNYKWLKPFKIILKPIVTLLLKIIRIIQRKKPQKRVG